MARLSLLMAAGFLLTSCGFLLNPAPDASLATGSLSLSVAGLSVAGARTIEPPVAMVSASYDISGSGPDAASFSATGITASGYQRDGLALGSWVITVTARNTDGTAIGEGSATVEIASGAPASATVTVRPYSGAGSISITVSWTEGAVANANVTGTVDRPDGTLGQAATFVANTDGHSWTWTDNAAAAGYHDLYFEIFSGTSSAAGGAATIRVLKDTLTEYEFAYTAEQLTLLTAKPALSLAAGTYTNTQNVIISCATSGATIKYTNNGSTPSATNGFTYSGPIAVKSTQTIRAIAMKAGHADSAIASSSYAIDGSIAVPTLSPAPGLYYDPIDVCLSCATAGALIMYTTDGVTVPAAYNGDTYVAPFAVAADTTVRAIAKNADGSLVSDLTEAVYRVTGHVAVPTASVSAGIYYAEQTVSLSCATETLEIRYTLDGSDPSLANGLAYSAPIVVDRSRTLKVRAFRTDWAPSSLASYQYELKVPSPSFNLDTGIYYAEQTVSLACALSGVTINWTNDGVTTPSATEGSAYTDPLTIERTRTVQAIAFRDGWTNSNLVTKTYTLKCVTPSFSPLPSDYADASLTVTMATSTPGANIAYTINGTTPSLTNGSFGTSKILTATTTLKAVAIKTGWNDSAVAEGLYTLEAAAVYPANGATVNDATPLLDWPSTVNAIKYHLQLAPTEAELASAAEIDATESIHQIETPLAPGTNRWWRYCTEDGVGTRGAWSVGVSFAYLLSAPSLSTPADGNASTNLRPTFSWSTAVGAISYELALSSSLAGLDSATPTPVSAMSWTPSSDLAYGTWYWRVRSKDSYGSYSAWSGNRSFTRNEPLLSMVSVPAGSFSNGTSTVNLSAYLMSIYEITQSQFQAVMGIGFTSSYGVGANYPLYYMSWYYALVFCNQLAIQEGLTPVYTISGSTNPANWGAIPTSNNSTWDAAVMNTSADGYRLPTEAEWEYAARGGTPVDSYTHAGSNTAGDVAWYFYSGETSHTVGGKMPNKLGLYDMSGNVKEWCWDWHGSYPSGTQTDPTGADSGSFRVIRGGSWDSYASDCTVSYRSYGTYNPPYIQYKDYGFRVVRRP